MRGHRVTLAGWILGLCSTLALPLSGQAVLRGVVREDGNGRPLIGVQVVVEGTELTTITSRTGSYEIKYPPSGTQIVLFRLVGFRPARIRLDIRERVETLLDARLVAFAVQLDSIVVAGEMNQPRGMGREGFEERRRMGFGQFIDSLELRRSENRRLSDLLRGRNGIMVAQNRYMTSTRNGCYMQIIYDEQSVYSPAKFVPPVAPPPTTGVASSRFTRQPRPMAQPTPLDINTFDVAGLEAVEVYHSFADTPLQFGGAAAGCGTVVLWSRRGGYSKP